MIYSPIVDLGNIDRVPVTLVHALDDAGCSIEAAEWHYSQIRSPDTFIRMEIGAHIVFGWAFWDSLTERMVQTIETGTVERPVNVSQSRSKNFKRQLKTFAHSLI